MTKTIGLATSALLVALTSSSCGDNGNAGPAPIITHPNPIVSRHKKVYSSPANGAAVTDGLYHNGGWTVPLASLPGWVAIQIGAGPTNVVVSWDDGGTYNYQDKPGTTVYGLPGAYQIDVSADSTNGMDGTWTTPVMVTDNVVRTRAHAIDFTGMSWVRMTVTAGSTNPDANGIQIGEIDVHDTSANGAALPDDTWFFMGDSITAFAYDRAVAQMPSFADLINMNANTAAYFPAMINGGIGGEKTADGLARLAADMALNVDYRFFVLGYGTNDAANSQVPVATFKSNMQTMIDMLKADGRTPVLPHIPFSDDGGHTAIPTYNAAIDELTAANMLPAGPDFYAWFMAHPDQLMQTNSQGMVDKLHPTDVGQMAMNQLWFDTALPLYKQQ
jgi:lysophospholipase L1-like esterase